MDSAAKTPHTADTLKILVCYHKPYTMPPNDDRILLPIHVGKALTDTDLHIQGDNQLNGRPCDNISDKNPSYCELTAIYWAWKNLRKLYPDVKYVGLFHYRRFFAFDERKFLAEGISKPEHAIKDYHVDVNMICKTLDDGKIIVARPLHSPYSMKIVYFETLISDDYRTLHDVLRDKFPDYYYSFMQFFEGSNKFSAKNMFIMRWEDFEEYCEWLFAVLSEVEPLIPYQNYNTYQKRVFGFMSERLLNVWLLRHNKKLKFCNVYGYMSDNVSAHNKFMEYFKRLLLYIRNETAFAILRTVGFRERQALKQSRKYH